MRFLALMAAAAALCAGPAFAAGYGDFTGRWRNNDPSTNDITRLRISFDGGNLDVRAWGQCTPRDCDWGTVDAVAYSPSPALNPATSATEIIAVYNPGFARKTLILSLRPGNRLAYTVYTRFSDGSRRHYVTRGLMRKFGGFWSDWPPGGGWPPGGPGGGWPPGGGPGGPGGWPPGGGGPGGGGLTLYEHVGYGGEAQYLNSDTPNFVSIGWNDVVSSLRVSGGASWEVCEHANYGGRCRVVSGDVPNLAPGGWNDMISSARRYYGGGGPGGPGGGPGGPGGGGLSFDEDCIGFNWNNVEARFAGGEWKVVDGAQWILSFGGNAAEAARAAQIIRHYRFTQQCFIGRPNASMSYWKRGAGIPSGGLPGDDCVNIDPDTAEARREGANWTLVDDRSRILYFGPRGNEARQAEEVVKNYRLTRQCFVGRPDPGMTYWLSE